MLPVCDSIMPKELSWLSFNARVLQEAADPSVPLIERVRFLGIYSSKTKTHVYLKNENTYQNNKG